MFEDKVQFVRPAALAGVELVTVAYRFRAFPMHMHAEYVLGVVTSGAEALETGGVRHFVAAGDVLRLHPGQPHANHVLGDDVLRYRVFYLPAEAIRPYLENDRLPSFDSAVVHGHTYAQSLADCHRLLSDERADRLEQETALIAVIHRMAANADALPPLVKASAAVRRVRAFIDARFAESFDLSALAALADLSVFHLVRCFKAGVGFSPLAYRNLRRIAEVRRRLLSDDGLADIAFDLGFADQSHMTRQFQNLVGISPGLYRQQLRSRPYRQRS